MLNDFEPTSNIKLWIRVPRSTSDTTSFVFDLDDRRNIGAPGSDGTRIIRLHEYSEAPELTRLGNHTLYLWLRDSAKETRIEIAKVKVFKQCPWCERRGADPEELITHLLAEHQDQLFERLVLRGEGVSTDRKSRLVCLGVEFGEKSCGETFSQSSLPDENAFTLLNRHWNSRHQGNLSYKIVDSPHNLPGDQEKWIWKCKIDSTHAIIPPPNDDASLADKKAHLREHLFDLFHQT